MATLNRHSTRATRKIIFATSSECANALSKLNDRYPDVQFKGLQDNIILVNLTDSRIYDLQVVSFVEALGGHLMPRNA